MSDMDYDDHLDGDECWNCGGEGRVNRCIDGCCINQDDIYCQYCSKRCDICNPPTPKQIEEGNKLRQVLADALADAQSPQDTVTPHD
jgi:hypothetical protein